MDPSAPRAPEEEADFSHPGWFRHHPALTVRSTFLRLNLLTRRRKAL